MSGCRVDECPAWASYAAHRESRDDDAFAQRLVASLVLPAAVPTGALGRYALKQIVFAVLLIVMTPEDRIAATLFHDHGLDESPNVRAVVDAVLPPDHARRVTSTKAMVLARAVAAWAWSHALVADHRVEALARAIAMPRPAMLSDTDGTIADIAARFDVSREDAASRVRDLEVHDDAPAPKVERSPTADAAARRVFVKMYGGACCTVEEAAIEHDREIVAWLAVPFDVVPHSAEWNESRRRLERAELRSRFYPMGWKKIHAQIERDRRRVSVGAAQ